MRISIISPACVSVPPPMYGGTELVVYNLVEGLTELGHEVILFAPKSSKVSCRLIPYIDNDIYFAIDSTAREKKLVGELAAKYAYAMSANEHVDIIHDHTFAKFNINIPVVHTLHGPANDISVKRCVDLSSNLGNYFISISDRQKELYLKKNKEINFAGTVHNSIDVKSFPYLDKKEDFFLFLGRANWEKGLDLAVRVALKAHIGLIMSVKMSEDFEKEFFKKEIKPLIDEFPKDLLFKFYEEIDLETKYDLYKRAKCTLFTSQWEEPFGLVMIESMICGTPVIGLNRGAAPEVIVNGKTGFIVETEEEMIEATKNIDQINPEDCRKHVEENFSREVMTKKYLDLFQKILSEKKV